MQKNFTIWLTGLPCSGKTTIAKKLKEELEGKGHTVVHLDGDVIRNKLNRDLGFSEKDRFENLRRIAHVAQLFNENNSIVIASFVSPTNKMRNMVTKIIENLHVIYVRCSVMTCQKRDTKGMYKKALLGEIKDFTGVSSPFQEPENSDIILDTENDSVDKCVSRVLHKLLINKK